MADSHLYSHHQCHFPTSKARSSNRRKSQQYHCVPIFSSDEAQERIQQALVTIARKEELFLTAWAVLLHEYVRGEVVSFASICSPDSPGEQALLSGSRKDGPSAVRSVDGNDVTVVRYRVSGNSRFQDVYKVSTEPRTASTRDQDDSVNTAVVFPGQLKPASCRQQDKEAREHADLQLRTQPWDISDHVRSPVSLCLHGSFMMMPSIQKQEALEGIINRNFAIVHLCILLSYFMLGNIKTANSMLSNRCALTLQ